MTNNDNSRRIGGLEPRAASPDLSRLIRKNRPAADAPPQNGPAATENESGAHVEGAAASRTPAATTPEKAKPDDSRATPATQQPAVDSETKRMTVYIASRHYARARAAYRATSYVARDRSWSDFVEKALIAELERREAEHNAGEPYAPDPSPLSPGRPLSS